MPDYAQQERKALADLLLEVGPDAPTLCEGWKTGDLAAHLVVRERRPDAALGIAVPAMAGYLDRVSRSIRDGQPWADLVQRVRNGPPLLLRPMDELVNTVEYYVHHEDVRCAGPGREPRALDPGLERALWSALRRMAPMARRKLPVGLTLEAPGLGEKVVRPGTPGVRAQGPPSELVLLLLGRQQVAKLELSGDPAAVSQVREAKLGI